MQYGPIPPLSISLQKMMQGEIAPMGFSSSKNFELQRLLILKEPENLTASRSSVQIGKPDCPDCEDSQFVIHQGSFTSSASFGNPISKS
ncbi:hypothetical protein Tco_1056211 [Tanacetum coccineum]|uniref:Uncharacterized protein n=1 Tax=Tanacetum coccineum TaxID=301880 RepID=A0ABQ5H328_9ASTR